VFSLRLFFSRAGLGVGGDGMRVHGDGMGVSGDVLGVREDCSGICRDTSFGNNLSSSSYLDFSSTNQIMTKTHI